MWELYLNDNNLSGSIPSELANLTKLTDLDLAGNRLSGQIPRELGDLPSLRWLRLSGNQFTGCIATSLMSVNNHDLNQLPQSICEGTTVQGAISCARGLAVASPEVNRGLVADCEALLAAREVLDPGTILNWSVDLPMTDWDGVEVSDEPRRVTEIDLRARRLTGMLPAKLGELSEVKASEVRSWWSGYAGRFI